MGQAAVDLPDPLQAPPDAVRTSTDELLSQLAGEEIDRLLAEAELAAPRGASSAPFHVAPPTEPEPETELLAPPPQVLPEGEPLAVAAAPAADAAVATAYEPVPAPPPPTPSTTEEAVAAELDALFSSAVEKDKADAEAQAAAAVMAEADGTSAAERAGLSTLTAMAPAPHAAAIEEDGPLPLYLKPLEWLSAPLAMFPPTVRELVGKVAIVTLINAAAILAYILIVRR